ncbi:MAG: hypothetical protein AAB922_06645 [Patescibacteria group bacterium]
MRYIKVHVPIQVINPVTGLPIAEPVQKVDAGKLVYERDEHGEPVLRTCSPWSMYDLLTRFVFSDKKLELKGKALSKFVRRLTKAFKKAQPGDHVIVDDADVEVLKKIMDDNEWGAVSGQLGDFYDAVEGASEEDPHKQVT